MKSVVVTGAAGGVGSAVVRLLLEESYHVIATDRSLTQLRVMRSQIAKRRNLVRKLDLIELDLTQSGRFPEFLDKIKACLDANRTLWGYVNNAAIYFPSSGRSPRLSDITIDDMFEIVHVNMISACLLSREMFQMLRRGRRGGSIVFISSLAGRKGSSLNPVYAMTKAALSNLARSLAHLGGRDHIRTNSISPGILETEMGSGIYKSRNALKERVQRNLIPRACRPDEVAHLVSYLLSDHSAYITGEDLDLSGGNRIK